MQITQQKIIFDFDRTLVSLQVDWQQWYGPVKQLLAEYDPTFDKNTAIDMSSLHAFIDKYGSSFRDAFVQIETTIEQKYYHGYTSIAETIRLLKQLQQQQKQLFLLTSNCRAVVLPILNELQIASYFSRIITINDVPNIKPSAVPFKLIHDGSPKTDYLMVGDSASDKGFARNVGIEYLDVQDITV